MEIIRLTYEETSSSTWRKVMQKVKEREAYLLRKLRSDLSETETAKIRGALKELEIVAGLANDENLPSSEAQ
jgi:hypothetical protein